MRNVWWAWVVAAGFSLAACGSDEPLCCVEIDPGEGLRALTCESEDAVRQCEGYDFSDCYYDSARDDEC